MTALQLSPSQLQAICNAFIDKPNGDLCEKRFCKNLGNFLSICKKWYFLNAVLTKFPFFEAFQPLFRHLGVIIHMNPVPRFEQVQADGFQMALCLYFD